MGTQSIGNSSLSIKRGESLNEIDNILDKRLDSKLEKITENKKKELLETFMINHSIHADKVSEQIERNRIGQVEEANGELNIDKISFKVGEGGAIAGIIKKREYYDIYNRYSGVLQDPNIKDIEKKQVLKTIDEELATRIVLDSSVSSVNYTFQRRAYFKDQLTRDRIFKVIKDRYTDGNVCFIKKSKHKLGEEGNNFFSIEWINEYKKKDKPDTDKPDTDKPDTDKPDTDKPDTVIPKPKFKHLDEELDVNFSDMKQTIGDISDERVYSEDSKEYVEAMEKKNSPFGRMLVSAKRAVFGDWFRYSANRKLVKSMTKDKTTEGLDLTSNWADIAGVHASQGVESVYTLLDSDPKYSGVYDEISDLSKEYYKGGSTFVDGISGEAEFETKLKDIFKNNPSFTEELEKKGVDVNRSAGDILQTLKIKREQNKLKFEIRILVDNTLSKKKGLASSDPAFINADNDFVSQLTSKFKVFTSKNKLYPEILQHYNKMNTTGDTINLGDSYENISRRLLAHTKALGAIATASMTNKIKLNIKFLAKGHSTDHIEKNDNEEFKRYKNPVAKLGNMMYGKGHRWRRGSTKALATGLTAVAGTAIFGPLGGILAGSIVAGSLAAGKKSAQLNRKKESLEKEYIKDTKNTSNFINDTESDQLESLKSIAKFKDLKKEFDSILADSPLDDKKLLPVLSLLMAGLDFQKKTGHNAFSIDNLSRGTYDVEKEHAYDKSMNELYKYKELSFMRLNLQGSSIDENWIQKQTEYKTILDTYMGKNSKFNKFVKSFKKDRAKSMLKTGATTAAIYGAAGGIARGLHHILGDSAASVDTGDVLTIDHNLGDISTNYDLGKFDASTSFSNDIGSKLSQLPTDTSSVQVDYFAGVDGTPANAASFTTETINNQVADIQELLNTGNFSQATIDSANSAISQNNIQYMISIAEIDGADVGNQNLFTSRNLEGVYEVLKQVDGKDKIDFDFNLDETQSIVGNTSHVPADRITGVDLTNIVEQPEVVVEENSSSLLDGQGLYTEDNTHKGEDTF